MLRNNLLEGDKREVVKIDMQLVNEGMDHWEVATERETIEQCKQRNEKGIVIVFKNKKVARSVGRRIISVKRFRYCLIRLQK